MGRGALYAGLYLGLAAPLAAAFAAGVGLLVVPQSLARLHHRRDLTYVPLAGAPASTASATTETPKANGGKETAVKADKPASERGPGPTSASAGAREAAVAAPAAAGSQHPVSD